MGRFIITEEERNHIKGLYEQDQLPREPLDPEAINGDFTLAMYVPNSLVRINRKDISMVIQDEIRELVPNYSIELRTVMTYGQEPGFTFLSFNVDAKNKDTMKQSPWLFNFGKNVKNKIIEIYKGMNINVNVTEPKYTWGEYFESELTNSPNKCIGLSYKVTTSQPTPQ